MSLGWHSPASGGGGSGATDPALLAVLSQIASNIADLTQAVKDLGPGIPPEPPITDCLVLAEDGSTIVDEAGNLIVFDCEEPPVLDCLVVSEAGDPLEAEDGSLITFYCEPLEDGLVSAEDGSSIVDEADNPVVAGG